MNKLKESSIIEIALPSVLFSFMLFVFAPFEIYLSNKGYFFFEGTEMLGSTILAFFVVGLSCMLLLYGIKTINISFFHIIYGMFIGGILSLYFQGNWDATDYGAWNGSEIDWSVFSLQKYFFLTLFVVLILGGGFVALKTKEKFCKIAVYVSVFLLLIQASTLTVLMLSNGGITKEKEYIATTENELCLSNQKNMLILILDAYDSEAFENIVNSDEGSKYSDILDGFTYYPDTIGAYSSTDMSMPFIITGSPYKNEILFGEHLNKAYEESALMDWLRTNGWEADIYSDILMPQANNGAGICNSKELKRVVSNRKQLMNYMYTMVLFRYMPQPIKNHFYFYADNIKGTLNKVAGEYTAFNGDNFSFYSAIDDLSVASTNNSGVFQLVHITGAHEPFTFNSDFMERDEETSYEDECEGILKVVDKLISKLKENDIYDDTVIFIMADHGFYNDRQNPLLLVKGYNEHHTMNTSDAAVSYYNLQLAYIRLLDEEATGADVFNYVGDASRGRKYAYVPWNTHLNFDTYSGTFSEVTFYGNARDLGGRVDEGIKYVEPEGSIIK